MNTRLKYLMLCAPGLLAARAQSFTPASPSQTETPAAVQQLDSEMSAARLTPGSPSYAPPQAFFSWGNISMRPHVTARYVYNSGLLTAPGAAPVDSSAETISPGMMFQLGPRWILDYTPSLNFYSNPTYENTVNHNVILRGGTRYRDWAFNLAQSYSRTSDPLVETGRQTDQEVFNTMLGASHYFNNKFHLEATANQSIRLTSAFSNARTWSTMEWLNYQVVPTIALGVGVGAGYDDVDGSSDMANQQFLGRVSARVLEKLSLSVSGGGEMREIIGSGGDPLLNPLYNASISYHPFDFTTVTLTGSRSISASLFAGQITENSLISLAMNQRLLGRLNLTLSGSYRNTAYILSNSSLAQNRADDSWSGLARLSYPFMRGAVLSTFYQFTSNQSSDSDFAFESTQVGVELSYHF